MSSPSDEARLETNFVIAVSVLGGATIFLCISTVTLFLWVRSLAKKLEGQEPPRNFQLQRPKLGEEAPAHPPSLPKPDYDNYAFAKKPLNPIANRQPNNFRNDNFMFGNANRLTPNSARTPDYMDNNNSFY